jgi:hypothetical protein
MISDEELWLKLKEFKVFRYQNNEPDDIDLFGKVLSDHINEFLMYVMSLNMSLKLYPLVLRMENKEGFINYDYLFHCDMILISLITSLESYLVRNFRKLTPKAKIEDLDMVNFVNFIKEFRIEPEYFKALKEHSNHEFNLSDVIPKRMEFQQKNKAKIACKLFKIYLPTLADKKQDTWERIFGEKNSYIALRHSAIHAGIINSILKKAEGKSIVNENIIASASLDISKFVYKLDKSISREFKKSECPNLYAQKVEE